MSSTAASSSDTATDAAATELLFSYGTLQYAQVQHALFGRQVEGESDALPGHARELLEIQDPKVVATSGQTHHPVVRHTGRPEDTIAGTVYRVTPQELRRADGYEVGEYRRARVRLASGQEAWAYLDGRAD